MTALATPLALYEGGLAARRLALLRRDGSRASLPVTRWLGDLGAFDRAALRRAAGPVLDIGCGPGRHLNALGHAGVEALGIDISTRAVRTARRNGGRAVVASAFDDVPGAGGYASALLLDGNIGIGGDPVALLARMSELLACGGQVLAEVGRPGSGTRCEQVRLELDGRRSRWFAWARVDTDGIGVAAQHAGLVVAELSEREGRWLAVLAAR